MAAVTGTKTLTTAVTDCNNVNVVIGDRCTVNYHFHIYDSSMLPKNKTNQDAGLSTVIGEETDIRNGQEGNSSSEILSPASEISNKSSAAEADSIAVAPKFEEPLKELNIDLVTLLESTKSEFNGTQLIVVEKETNENAGRENASMRREVYQNHPAILEVNELRVPLRELSEPESRKGKTSLIGKIRRRSRGGSHGASLTRQKSLNIGSDGTPDATPETTRKFPTPEKMCRSCVSTGENRLPDARDEWPIDRIETGCFHEICESLGLDDYSKVPLLSALGCFKHKEGLVIKKNHKPTEVAEIALIRWGGLDHRRHNVGALRKILKDSMQRNDVIQEFEKWEKMSVCHGCGVKFSKP